MRTSGVYTITNLQTRAVYVGASRKIESRWQEHKSTLKHGTHRSAELQADWDAIGAGQFIFAIAGILPLDASRADLATAERSVIARLLGEGVSLYNAVSNVDGEKLKAARKKAALSMRDLEALSGVKLQTIHRIETHKVDDAYPSTIRKLAAALKVEPAELMSEQEDGQP